MTKMKTFKTVASVCEEEQGLYVDELQRGEMFWLTSLSNCN